MNLISQYRGLRKENYILCFGGFVTSMGSMVRPMLTMILHCQVFKTARKKDSSLL